EDNLPRHRILGDERLLDLVQAQWASRTSSMEDRSGSFGRCDRRALDHGATAGDRFETAVTTAPAAIARFAHDGVADLAGAIPVALKQLTVEDDAGADPVADVDDDHAAGVRPTAEGELGERRGLAVVGNVDGKLVTLCKESTEGQVLPVEIDRPADRAGGRVDDARRPDANP